MSTKKIYTIQELAQGFKNMPMIIRSDKDLRITYEYELQSGYCGEGEIIFDDVTDFRFIKESEMTVELLENAYNAIAIVIDSEWVKQYGKERGLNHYRVYFDDIGAYEILAKKCNKITDIFNF